ncbi:MAG TPA: cellulase family glycosylhydrolase [Drouetiella sp.]
MTLAFDQNLTPSDRSRDGQNDSQMRNTAASQWNNAENFRSATQSMTSGDTTNGALPNVSISQGDSGHGSHTYYEGRAQGDGGHGNRGGHGGHGHVGHRGDRGDQGGQSDQSGQGSDQADVAQSLKSSVNKLGELVTKLGDTLSGSGSGSEAQKSLSAELTQFQKDATTLTTDLNSLSSLLDKYQGIGTTGGDATTGNSTSTTPGDTSTGTPTSSTPGDTSTCNPTPTTPGDTSTGNPTSTTPGDTSTGNPNSTTPGDTTPTTNPTTGDKPVTPTTQPGGPNTGFSIAGGKLTMNGKTLAGIAVTSEYAQQVGPQALADKLSSQFPGMNVVRLSASPEGGAFTNGQTLAGGASVDDIVQTVAALNAKGIGVIIDNHGADANDANNVSQNGNEPAWFAALAKAEANNNMVMFQPENEPMGTNADVAAEQKNAYDAIRSAENSTPGSVQHVVAFDLVGGGYAGPQQDFASQYDAMSNYVIDAHAYASNSSDPVSAIQTEVAQVAGLTEADGSKVPVSIFETGNAIDGSNKDPMANDLLNYVYPTYGAVAWLYDGAATGFGNGSDADHLTDPNGNLTPFGQQIAGLIASTTA